MTITQITENKKQYLDLLLLADEQESMIDRYLERGELFVLEDEGVKAVGVVTDEGDGVCELKNIAVAPGFQRQGYGRRLIGYLCIHYSGKYTQMTVGTGDVPGHSDFTEIAGLNILIVSRIFLRTTTTIRSWRKEYCWKIWFI